MACLIHKKSRQTLAQNVITVRGFFSRLRGLMWKNDFPSTHTMWILPCKGGIHTCFMKFSIDVIFVNRSLEITSVYKNIHPWKLVEPFLSLFSKTYSVFEFKSPALDSYHLQKGDQLEMGN